MKRSEDKEDTNPPVKPEVRGTWVNGGWLMFALGIVIIIASYFYSSSVLATIGVGLLFWGVVLRYISREDYVKRSVMDASLLPFTAMDSMLNDLNFKGEAIYLPSSYLEDVESNRAYVPRTRDQGISPPECFYGKTGRLAGGLLLVPPGDEMARLLEKTLGTNFTRTDLGFLQENLPSTLVDKLEIAEDVQIRIEDSTMTFKVVNCIYNGFYAKLGESPHALGTPLTSALACAMAKSSGKPVKILKDELGSDGRTAETVFKAIEPYVGK